MTPGSDGAADEAAGRLGFEQTIAALLAQHAAERQSDSEENRRLEEEVTRLKVAVFGLEEERADSADRLRADSTDGSVAPAQHRNSKRRSLSATNTSGEQEEEEPPPVVGTTSSLVKSRVSVIEWQTRSSSKQGSVMSSTLSGKQPGEGDEEPLAALRRRLRELEEELEAKCGELQRLQDAEKRKSEVREAAKELAEATETNLREQIIALKARLAEEQKRTGSSRRESRTVSSSGSLQEPRIEPQQLQALEAKLSEEQRSRVAAEERAEELLATSAALRQQVEAVRAQFDEELGRRGALEASERTLEERVRTSEEEAKSLQEQVCNLEAKVVEETMRREQFVPAKSGGMQPQKTDPTRFGIRLPGLSPKGGEAEPDSAALREKVRSLEERLAEERRGIKDFKVEAAALEREVSSLSAALAEEKKGRETAEGSAKDLRSKSQAPEGEVLCLSASLVEARCDIERLLGERQSSVEGLTSRNAELESQLAAAQEVAARTARELAAAVAARPPAEDAGEKAAALEDDMAIVVALKEHVQTFQVQLQEATEQVQTLQAQLLEEQQGRQEAVDAAWWDGQADGQKNIEEAQADTEKLKKKLKEAERELLEAQYALDTKLDELCKKKVEAMQQQAARLQGEVWSLTAKLKEEKEGRDKTIARSLSKLTSDSALGEAWERQLTEFEEKEERLKRELEHAKLQASLEKVQAAAETSPASSVGQGGGFTPRDIEELEQQARRIIELTQSAELAPGAAEQDWQAKVDQELAERDTTIAELQGAVARLSAKLEKEAARLAGGTGGTGGSSEGDGLGGAGGCGEVGGSLGGGSRSPGGDRGSDSEGGEAGADQSEVLLNPAKVDMQSKQWVWLRNVVKVLSAAQAHKKPVPDEVDDEGTGKGNGKKGSPPAKGRGKGQPRLRELPWAWTYKDKDADFALSVWNLLERERDHCILSREELESHFKLGDDAMAVGKNMSVTRTASELPSLWPERKDEHKAAVISKTWKRNRGSFMMRLQQSDIKGLFETDLMGTAGDSFLQLWEELSEINERGLDQLLLHPDSPKLYQWSETESFWKNLLLMPREVHQLLACFAYCVNFRKPLERVPQEVENISTPCKMLQRALTAEQHALRTALTLILAYGTGLAAKEADGFEIYEALSRVLEGHPKDRSKRPLLYHVAQRMLQEGEATGCSKEELVKQLRPFAELPDACTKVNFGHIPKEARRMRDVILEGQSRMQEEDQPGDGLDMINQISVSQVRNLFEETYWDPLRKTADEMVARCEAEEANLVKLQQLLAMKGDDESKGARPNYYHSFKSDSFAFPGSIFSLFRAFARALVKEIDPPPPEDPPVRSTSSSSLPRSPRPGSSPNSGLVGPRQSAPARGNSSLQINQFGQGLETLCE